MGSLTVCHSRPAGTVECSGRAIHWRAWSRCGPTAMVSTVSTNSEAVASAMVAAMLGVP